MNAPNNIERFPYAKRLKQVMQGTTVATRTALRKLCTNLGTQSDDNVVDLEAAREEIKMNRLGW